MKIRRSILFLTAIAVLLIAWMLWHVNRKPMEAPLATSTETNITARSESRPLRGSAVHTNAPPVITGVVSNSALGSKIEREREILSTYNDVPIDFYGKLEDQFGGPVVEAEVKGSIRVINGDRRGADQLTTTSDANGLFQFHGKGQDISTMPSKKGYALASLNGGGNYSMLAPEGERLHPDPNNPVVIKMWKLQGAEPLLSINQHYKLHYTPQPIYFDLLTSEVVPNGGDIKLIVKRPQGIISGQNRPDWSVQVEAVGGGVMDSGGQERVAYVAPETGYESSTNFIFSTNPPYKWFGGFDQGFFLMSRNGQVYSKLRFSFNINDDPDGLMSIAFRGIANTNSSRNWEGDPNTMNVVAK
jgi:hypothetical protein